ncbi:MAG TPA: SDR family oxidoreductase [Candidatus Acidoferrales bacterium]|nr:SDR family oxidoreductase [Candidatus Acidoferrales bacterium]
MAKRVLVTGGAGYIGSVLTEMLLDQGFEVSVLDRFFFGPTLQHLNGRAGLTLIKGDIRWLEPSILNGVDAVCDLAALSNDPAGELDPSKTMEINYRGRARIAHLAKARGVRRYVLASSCSIYGFQEAILDERSTPNPLTTYAQANLRAEQEVLPLASEEFCVTVLRQATVYGLSPRMRFDLAINGMTLGVFEKGVIPLLRDGSQWRPMVHVRDASRAFGLVLKTAPRLVNGQIFNVGADEQNFQILPLAQRIAEAVDRPFAYEWYGVPDHRSYRVSFRKIHDLLDYRAEYIPEDAAHEIFSALQKGQSTPDSRTRTVEWYKNLLQWHEILRGVVLNDAVL